MPFLFCFNYRTAVWAYKAVPYEKINLGGEEGEELVCRISFVFQADLEDVVRTTARPTITSGQQSELASVNVSSAIGTSTIAGLAVGLATLVAILVIVAAMFLRRQRPAEMYNVQQKHEEHAQ